MNDRLKRESQENLDQMKKTANEKGFKNVEVIRARGDPAKISCFESFLEIPNGTSFARMPRRRRSTPL